MPARDGMPACCKAVSRVKGGSFPLAIFLYSCVPLSRDGCPTRKDPAKALARPARAQATTYQPVENVTVIFQVASLLLGLGRSRNGSGIPDSCRRCRDTTQPCGFEHRIDRGYRRS